MKQMKTKTGEEANKTHSAKPLTNSQTIEIARGMRSESPSRLSCTERGD